MPAKPLRRQTGTRRKPQRVALALFFRSRRLVVRGAENFFPAVGQDNVRLLCQINVRRSALDAPAGDCKFVAELKRTFVPAEVIGKSVSSANLGLPTHGLTFLIRYVEHDDGVRIDELHLDHGSS